MSKELIIEVVQPTITANFKTFVEALKLELEPLRIEVTSENLKEAKASSAKLNKIRDAIKAKEKEHLAIIEQPMIEFKENMKKLYELIKGERDLISSGVGVFEDAKKLEHKVKLDEYTQLVLEKYPTLEPEFTPSGLPSLSVSGLTAKGELQKKYKDMIEDAIKDGMADQEQRDIAIENQRLKDEARAREIVDQEKQKELNSLRDYKHTPQEAPQTPEPDLFSQPEPRQPEPIKQPVVEKTEDGKAIYVITATFHIKAKIGLDPMLVAQKAKSVLIKEGIEPETLEAYQA